MADSPVENVFLARTLPWRTSSGLHEDMGPRVAQWSPLVMKANTPFTLFNGQFGPHSIDRIIGCKLFFGNCNAPGALTLADIFSGYQWSIFAAQHLGNYNLNIITLPEVANIVLTSSFDVSAAMNVYVALLNFEIPEGSMGHSG